MIIKQIIKFATEAAEGKDNFEEGAVGYNGYGFVFKDLKSNTEVPFIFSITSHKYCETGSSRDILKHWKKVKTIEELQNLARLDEYDDLLFAGSLKTLVPTLQFGGFTMFNVWMFVKTPKDRFFPATFYWGQSGPTVGGWASYGITPFVKEIVFPEEFLEFINFSPFRFTEDEKNCFLDALEFALRKVPPSDFWGVFNRDIGNSYMGLKRGRPFTRLMRHFERKPEAEKALEPLLGKKFKVGDGLSFTISLLPRMRIYVVEYECEYADLDSQLGSAEEILELYKDGL